MDSKDFQLLVALHVDARQSLRALGRRVSLSHVVVRERLRSLESRGVLRGYRTLVDPGVLDRDDLIAWFEGDWTMQDAKKALGSVDVAWVALKVDGDLTVQLWPLSRDLAVNALSDVLGASPSGQFLASRRLLTLPSLIDWRIVDQLINDPRMPLRNLIRETGFSPKTLRKHLETLIRGGSISITPNVGSLADSGDLVYTVSVFGNPGMSELRRVLGDAFLVKQFHEPPAKYLLCRGSDLNEVTGKTHAVEKLSGVESVSITLNREMLTRTDFIHSLVRRRIDDLEKAQMS